MGLRDRKKLQTRKALFESACELFEEKGYTETSIEEIAARANFAPRTFFLHFASKEELLFINSDEIEDRLVDIFKHREDLPTLKAFRKWQLEVVIPELSRNPKYEKLRRRIVMESPALQARVEAYINNTRVLLAKELAKDKGNKTTDLQSRMEAELLIAVFTALYNHGAERLTSPDEAVTAIDKAINFIAENLNIREVLPPAKIK